MKLKNKLKGLRNNFLITYVVANLWAMPLTYFDGKNHNSESKESLLERLKNETRGLEKCGFYTFYPGIWFGATIYEKSKED